jgi:hypothetical protein
MVKSLRIHCSMLVSNLIIRLLLVYMLRDNIYPNANLIDVREERDSEEGYNFRGEDGWCEPHGLPRELR